MSSNPPPIDGLNRILVVKLADLGDAILATSAIGALRRTYPAARIDVLTTANGATAFRLCPAIDRVIAMDKEAFDDPRGLVHPLNALKLANLTARLRRTRYGAVVLLQHLTTPFGARKYRWLCRAVGAPVRAGLDNGHGAFLTHRAIDYGFGVKSVHDYNLDVVARLGAKTDDARPLIVIPPRDQESARRLLAEHRVTNPYIVIHPTVGAYSSARNWPVERFATVAHSLRSITGCQVVLVGARDATEAVHTICASSEVVNLVGKTSFGALGEVLRGARLVIGSDSSVTHLAAATATPTLAIFGPSNHNAWKPYGAVVLSGQTAKIPESTAYVVRSDIPCSPCFYTGYSLGRREG
ncbi:MAG TPA: glycosyltransferase family 9 protein, partial [Nitrolancea sp.]|nr:glycosyltransferase family 9 protein [Nitrolancea sp.]